MRKKFLGLVLAVLTIVSSITGCSSSPTPTETAVPTQATETAEPTQEAATSGADNVSETPREETLYTGGLVWGSINDWNPLSGNSNNNFIEQNNHPNELVYETLLAFNFLDGKLYPLLATDYSWNNDETVMTLHLNPDAKWSDGTGVTAEDVAYTFDTHVKYSSAIGQNYSKYIESIEAADDTTVLINAKKDKNGKSINPLLVLEYIPKVYVMQKAYLQTVEQRNGEDAEKVKTDTMDDFVTSAPYKVYYTSDQKTVFIRNDQYWGQSDSLWGKLPTPKYISNIVYKDDASVLVALQKGEADVCDLFVANVQDLWEKQGLPISTYLDEAPYGICTQMPTLWFNTERKGLDNVAVRKAIAYAVDYDQIVSNAMSNQSPTFSEVSRSLMNPTEGEQVLVDHDALTEYNFTGNDIEGANKILDDAGIVDTDGDGIREIDGKNLTYKAQCPKGWSDWQAAIEIVAAAGKKIGINIETYYPDRSVHVNDYSTGNFDIAMAYSVGASAASPWSRCMNLLSSSYNDLTTNLSGNYGHYSNARADELLDLTAHETDQNKLKEYYTELSKLYLEEVPSVSLMYRPQSWNIVNESIWTGFPHDGDGSNIPPELCMNGFGIAGLYNLRLSNE